MYIWRTMRERAGTVLCGRKSTLPRWGQLSTIFVLNSQLPGEMRWFTTLHVLCLWAMAVPTDKNMAVTFLQFSCCFLYWMWGVISQKEICISLFIALLALCGKSWSDSVAESGNLWVSELIHKVTQVFFMLKESGGRLLGPDFSSYWSGWSS